MVPSHGMSLKRWPTIFSTERMPSGGGCRENNALCLASEHYTHPKTQHLQAWVILGKGLFLAFIEESSIGKKVILCYFILDELLIRDTGSNIC